jgi:hypothetical protein
MSHRVKELAQKERRLQERCAAQRASLAQQLAAIEARFTGVDRMAGLARRALLHPAVIVGGIVALLTIGRLRGMRFIGRLYLLSTAARRLTHVVKVLTRAGGEQQREGRI